MAKKILVVDDDKSIIGVVVNILEEHKYEVAKYEAEINQWKDKNERLQAAMGKLKTYGGIALGLITTLLGVGGTKQVLIKRALNFTKNLGHKKERAMESLMESIETAEHKIESKIKDALDVDDEEVQKWMINLGLKGKLAGLAKKEIHEAIRKVGIDYGTSSDITEAFENYLKKKGT